MGQQIRSFRDLTVWRKAVDLVVLSYRSTKTFPASEMYGLTSQIRRAATSVAANIAEGHGRDHLGDYLRHLSVAKGSLTELETHFVIAVRLQYLPEAEAAPCFDLINEVGRMLSALTRSLSRKG